MFNSSSEVSINEKENLFHEVSGKHMHVSPELSNGQSIQAGLGNGVTLGDTLTETKQTLETDRDSKRNDEVQEVMVRPTNTKIVHVYTCILHHVYVYIVASCTL